MKVNGEVVGAIGLSGAPTSAKAAIAQSTSFCTVPDAVPAD
jgi:uncharacterized protein GlcG (DUF336 family)